MLACECAMKRGPAPAMAVVSRHMQAHGLTYILCILYCCTSCTAVQADEGEEYSDEDGSWDEDEEEEEDEGEDGEEAGVQVCNRLAPSC